MIPTLIDLTARRRPTHPLLARVLAALRRWAEKNGRTYIRRERERAMVAELLSLAEPYKRDELLATVRWAVPREDGWRE